MSKDFYYISATVVAAGLVIINLVMCAYYTWVSKWFKSDIGIYAFLWSLYIAVVFGNNVYSFFFSRAKLDAIPAQNLVRYLIICIVAALLQGFLLVIMVRTKLQVINSKPIAIREVEVNESGHIGI